MLSPRCEESESNSSGRLSPWPGMPRICRAWLRAIMIPDAVMKPDTTGWDRKLAMKPKRRIPMTSSINPEIMAMAIAATT